MTIKIDEKVLKKIITNYKSFLTDDTDIGEFIKSIYQKIDLYRIKVVESIDEALSDDPNIIHESYCHAFYRMLGLPVTDNQNSFYSPGYYSPNYHDYKSIREKISKNQNPSLVNLETIRETINSVNISVFLSKTKDSHDYKINMLRHPRSVVILKETINAFDIDMQVEMINGRAIKYQRVQHIIRPFRCSPNIAPVEKILVPKKNLAAPFFHSNNDNEKYNTTYLETVCKTRFATRTRVNNSDFTKPLIDLLKTIEINGQNVFSNVLNQQSLAELYALNILINKFIQMSLDYADKSKKYKSFANMYSDLDIQVSYISDYINELELKKAQYEIIQSFLPNQTITVNGQEIQTSNIDDGVLTGELTHMLNSPVIKIDEALNDANNKKKTHMSQINNLSNDLFNMTGEVFGISALEALALMISFWAIPQRSLLSLLDDPAFTRLFSKNPLLRNEVVLERYNASRQAPQQDINTVIGEIDTIVYNLLYLADAIIQYSYRDSET